jgi:hypothetical protein
MWDDKKTLGISKRWHLANPPLGFTRNQNMGNIIEKGNWQNKWMGGMVMGECNTKILKRKQTSLLELSTQPKDCTKASDLEWSTPKVQHRNDLFHSNASSSTKVLTGGSYKRGFLTLSSETP